MPDLDHIIARDNQVSGSERALIGSALTSPDQVISVEHVYPQDFASASHQIIWAEIIAEHNNQSLSAQGVIETLRARGTLESVGSEFGSRTGSSYVEECVTYSAPASIAVFAENVMEASTRRAIRRNAALMVADADGDEPTKEILERVEQAILDMRRNTKLAGKKIGSIMTLFKTATDQRLDGTFVPAYQPHHEGLRRILTFLEDQDYMIIAARPGEGKSSMMRYEAFHEALAGRPTTIINMENSEIEYARTLVAMETKINAEKLRNPRELSAYELQRMRDAIGRLSNIPLNIVTMGSPNIHQVKDVMRQAVRDGARTIWVDYIQLIRNGRINENDDLTMSSTGLRGFALQNHVPVIAGSQLSRDITHRSENANPQLSDLRGSGSLEQDATQVLFLRNVWTNPTEEQMMEFTENLDYNGNLAEVIRAVPMVGVLEKNRNGGTGKTRPFKWDKAINSYEEITS
jgi:replicative DNA helicase